MGNQKLVIELCLSHLDGGKRGVTHLYNPEQYRAQKQAVLQAWSDLVEEAVGRG